MPRTHAGRGLETSLDRRDLLRVVGATVFAGVVTGCADTTSPPSGANGILLQDPSLDLVDLPVDELDETELVQATTRFFADVMRDAESGNTGAAERHMARSAQLFVRSQSILKKKYKAKIIYGTPDDLSAASLADWGAADWTAIDLNALPLSNVEIDRRCRELQSTLVSATLTNNQMRVVVAVLAVLGVSNYVTTFIELVPVTYWTALTNAVARKSWWTVKSELARILNYVISPIFRVNLILKLGKSVAARIVASILALLIPFVGWTLLIGRLIVQLGKLLLT